MATIPTVHTTIDTSNATPLTMAFVVLSSVASEFVTQLLAGVVPIPTAWQWAVPLLVALLTSIGVVLDSEIHLTPTVGAPPPTPTPQPIPLEIRPPVPLSPAPPAPRPNPPAQPSVSISTGVPPS